MEYYVVLDSFKDELLDLYLENGWFRMLYYMFTTRYIEKDEQLFRVYWLRYNINKINYERKQNYLLNLNKKFTVSIEPLVLNEELECLFQIYKNHAAFINYDSLATAFCSGLSIFNTYVIKVRDNDKLIAAGFLDKGKNAIAGIMNIYHPDYPKYSLGKYLILQKIAFCQKNHIATYYPGYLVPGIPKFDYKLFPDKNATDVWVFETCQWKNFNIWKLTQYAKNKDV